MMFTVNKDVSFRMSESVCTHNMITRCYSNIAFCITKNISVNLLLDENVSSFILWSHDCCGIISFMVFDGVDSEMCPCL